MKVDAAVVECASPPMRSDIGHSSPAHHSGYKAPLGTGVYKVNQTLLSMKQKDYGHSRSTVFPVYLST